MRSTGVAPGCERRSGTTRDRLRPRVSPWHLDRQFRLDRGRLDEPVGNATRDSGMDFHRGVRLEVRWVAGGLRAATRKLQAAVGRPAAVGRHGWRGRMKASGRTAERRRPAGPRAAAHRLWAAASTGDCGSELRPEGRRLQPNSCGQQVTAGRVKAGGRRPGLGAGARDWLAACSAVSRRRPMVESVPGTVSPMSGDPTARRPGPAWATEFRRLHRRPDTAAHRCWLGYSSCTVPTAPATRTAASQAPVPRRDVLRIDDDSMSRSADRLRSSSEAAEGAARDVRRSPCRSTCC